MGARNVGQAALILVAPAVLLGVPAPLGFVTPRGHAADGERAALRNRVALRRHVVVHGRGPPPATMAGRRKFEAAETMRRAERWRSERVVATDDRLSALSTARSSKR